LKSKFPSSLALRGSAVLLLLMVIALPLAARTHYSAQWVDAQYDKAEKLRQALEQQPEKLRTRRAYERAIAAYRRVYYASPTSGKADPSVAAVADLRTEMGRQFKDDDVLRSAIKEYEFLRQQYPGSRSRVEALFTIGQIYKDDLNDPEQASDTFHEFLRRYPHSSQAADVRKALDDLAQQASLKKNQKDDRAAADDKITPVTGIRYWTTAESTRIAIDLGGEVNYDSQRIDHPERIYFDLFGTKLAKGFDDKSLDVQDSLLHQIRAAEFKPGETRVVLEVGDDTNFTVVQQADPPRLLIDLRPSQQDRRNSANESGTLKKTIVEADAGDATSAKPAHYSRRAGKRSATAVVQAAQVREAQPTADGDRSLIRALGLKIGKIVIDPGHGGYDTGTIGPTGLEEKNVVLDVSLRLGRLLEKRLGADVVYTRTDDTFVPLEQRTAIANQEQADLFISIHANSSHDPDARGVETYYLNFTSSPDALEVAARENAVSDKSIHQLQDLVKKIALKEKVEESREFAGDVEESLYRGLSSRNPGIRDRGVKQAPFIVLIGANMPSILAEISFLSNPGDERRLRSPEFRQRIAESLYRGIANYIHGLSGVKVASKVEKADAQ
jgi:N-acetylmuramoyl-L-alanine amidase